MINGFYRGDGAQAVWPFAGGQPQPVGLHQALDQNLIIVARFNICHKDFIGHQRLYKFLLLGKSVGLLRVIHPVVHHTPDGRVPGTGHRSHDLYGVLPVENIVDPVPSANLDRIDLTHIEMPSGLLYVGNREVALICLVGNQIFNGNFLKMYVRNKIAVVRHDHPSFFMAWRSASTSFFSWISSFRAACFAPADTALKTMD